VPRRQLAPSEERHQPVPTQDLTSDHAVCPSGVHQAFHLANSSVQPGGSGRQRCGGIAQPAAMGAKGLAGAKREDPLQAVEQRIGILTGVHGAGPDTQEQVAEEDDSARWIPDGQVVLGVPGCGHQLEVVIGRGGSVSSGGASPHTSRR
jgi:hypothetical protein